MKSKIEGEAIGYRQLRLVSPYDVQRLETIRLEKSVNEHGKLTVTGLLPEEKADRYIEIAGSNDTIELQEVDDEGKVVRTLFQGVIDECSVCVVRHVYSFEITALSYTHLMDVKRKTRTFQDKQMTYRELLETVVKRSYPKSDFIIDVSVGKKPLGEIAVQYEETDWQFLKRMASRLGYVLVPESAARSPKLWVGLPESWPMDAQLPAFHSTLKKPLADVQEANALSDGESFHHHDYLSYEIETARPLNIGDRVMVAGKERVISKVIGEMIQGLWTYTYTVSLEKGVRQNRLFNEQLIGASLEGRIIEVAADKVRLHLAVDESQAKEKACWFPFASAYTAEGNSGFFFMPELGDAVQLYFPDEDENSALALSSVRKSGQDSPQMADPAVKYLGNPHGKEMMLGKKELSLTAKQGVLFISIHEDDGITIQSDSTIAFQSKDDVELEAKKLAIEAEEGIYLVSGESSLILDGDTDLKGEDVLLEGLIKGPVEVPPLDEEERPPPEPPPPPEEPKKKGFWDKVLDVVQVGLDVVGCVPVVGIVANVANAGISAGRGDWAGAGLSMAACIPGAGPLLKGGKLAKGIGSAVSSLAKGASAGKAMNATQKARHIAQNAYQFTLDGIKSVKGKVFSGSRSGTSSQDLQEMLGKLSDRMQAVLVGQSNLGRKLATNFAVGSTRLLVEDYLYENYGIDLPFFPLNRKAFSTKLGATSRGGTGGGSGQTPKGQGDKKSKKEHNANHDVEVAKAQQRSVINAVENGSVKLTTNKQKGNYGEMKMDDYFESQGYSRISTGRVTSLDDKIVKGIDGVYENASPPPKFVIGEAKYGTSQLGSTKSGKQMSDEWINSKDRLDKAVGTAKADEIRLEYLLNKENVQKRLVNIGEDGTIRESILNSLGENIK